MLTSVDRLVLDLLGWIGPRCRPYAEVIDVWHASCPRLTVWEDANERGFIAYSRVPDRGGVGSVSDAGAAHLGENRPRSAQSFRPA